MGRLLLHPVGWPYSPWFIPPSSRNPTSIQTQGLICPLLHHLERLRKEPVFKAWGVITVTHLLDGLPDHRKPPDAQDHTGRDRRLTRQLKTYGIEDPPAKREYAALLGIVQSFVAMAATTFYPKTHHLTKLVQLIFYLCLRACEYTKGTSHRQTFQFRPLLAFVFFVGYDSSHPRPQLNTSRTQPRSSLLWKIRIMQSKENMSLTSDLSQQ